MAITSQPDADEAIKPHAGSTSAYLLTWNPEHFQLGGDGAVTPGTEHRWTCHSKQPRIGDTVYLTRLGLEPRGIVARGVVTAGSYEAAHWKDPTKQTRYIKFRVEELRLTNADGMLPIVLLSLAAPHQRWSPQSSGIQISEEAETILGSLWNKGAGVHGLRQFVNWIVAEAEAGDPVLRRWIADYSATTRQASELRGSGVSLPESILDHLWRAPANGVTHVGPGTLSNKEFAENLEFLRQQTVDILRAPTAATLAAVKAAWKQAVASKKFRMQNTAVIHRMFAAASPERYTTILKESDIQRALALLKRQFELEPARSGGSDWVALNEDVMTCMRAAGLDTDHAMENNVALWKLIDYLDGGAESQPPPEAEDEPTPASETTAEARVDVVPPTNLVLYGPPGTGKTFQLIEEAIALLAPEMLEGEPQRTSIKAKFDELVDTGQIVFTTFHQSFSYEDFVEGLRADADAEGRLRYRVMGGLFKRLCGYEDSEPAEATSRPFEPNDRIGNYLVSRCTNDLVEFKKPNGNVLPFSINMLRELAQLTRSGRIALEDIKQGNVFEKVKDSGLEPYLVNGYKNILPLIVERLLATDRSLGATGRERVARLPKVLIIDEINRGNVARIFGELITLIEPSKRAGMPDALTVTLPYSKTRFSVPADLHILASMNTADRSLVGLDVALRRRFQFRELEPRPDLLDDISVEGISVGQLLRTLNDRVESLLDRDHRLGHAYFFALRSSPSLNELALVFRSHVIPLLQEYFFEDYEKVRWVLNDHRKPTELQFLMSADRSHAKLFGDDVAVPAHSGRWRFNADAFANVDAYVATLAHTIA